MRQIVYISESSRNSLVNLYILRPAIWNVFPRISSIIRGFCNLNFLSVVVTNLVSIGILSTTDGHVDGDFYLNLWLIGVTIYTLLFLRVRSDGCVNMPMDEQNVNKYIVFNCVGKLLGLIGIFVITCPHNLHLEICNQINKCKENKWIGANIILYNIFVFSDIIHIFITKIMLFRIHQLYTLGKNNNITDILSDNVGTQIPFNENVKGLSCIICFEYYNEELPIIKTICKHIYHKECLSDWVCISYTCPICRKDFSSSIV
jgi:hypothetical protein